MCSPAMMGTMPSRKSAPSKKVLVIEDDADVSEVLALLLRKFGVQVVIAADGITGVELTRKERPDLVLVDLQLPGMNGLEVIRSIRSIPGCASLPLIVITGNSTVEYIRETARLGADDFLVKANVLAGTGLERIKKWLAPARQDRTKTRSRK